MTEPIKTMVKMGEVSRFLGSLPGADRERISRLGADKMRKVVASNLSSSLGDTSELEMYNTIRKQEDEMLASDDVDTGGIPEGEARMLCQIALVKNIVEEGE